MKSSRARGVPEGKSDGTHTGLLIPDITRNARAANLRKFSNLHIVGSRYVTGMITVNSLIYDIPCIISRDFMRHEFPDSAARKLVPLQMKRDKFGPDGLRAMRRYVSNDVCVCCMRKK
jgi:hypothetical protein